MYADYQEEDLRVTGALAEQVSCLQAAIDSLQQENIAIRTESVALEHRIRSMLDDCRDYASFAVEEDIWD